MYTMHNYYAQHYVHHVYLCFHKWHVYKEVGMSGCVCLPSLRKQLWMNQLTEILQNILVYFAKKTACELVQ